MASKIEIEIEVKSSAEKMWKIIKEFATFVPKAMPHIYEGIQVLEGDGKSVGSVLLASYKPDSKFASYCLKERIEVMDDEKKTLSCNFLEGTILQSFKYFKDTACINAKDEGAIVKYTIEFEKANEEVPNPDDFGDFVVDLFHCLDDYILNNNI